MSEKDKQKVESGMSRRKFLKGFGLTVAGAALGGGVVGGLIKGEDSTPMEIEELPEFNKALMYFNRDQFEIVESATERIFPADDNGPGATDLHVAYYIDHQLVSDWGTMSKDYRDGPFYPGEATQGYQGHLNRREIFDIGIKGLQDYSLKEYKESFKNLEPEQQDKVLTAFEGDKVSLKGVSSSYFFGMLCTCTLEGAYSDPLYGGNRNMEGWKMKNFPGHQASYLNIIESDEFTVVPPQSLNSQH